MSAQSCPSSSCTCSLPPPTSPSAQCARIKIVNVSGGRCGAHAAAWSLQHALSVCKRLEECTQRYRNFGARGSMAQSGSHPAPPPFGVLAIVLASGSNHEQPLPSKRLFVSFPTSPHKTPMRVCCRHSYKVTASRSRSDSKLIKLLYYFLLKMSSRKRLSPSACGRASSRWRSPSAGGRRGLQLYTAAAALYSVLCAFCADRRPTCVFGACLHLRTCALCLRECVCAYALLCLFLRVHLRRRGESARSSACVHVYVCMYYVCGCVLRVGVWERDAPSRTRPRTCPRAHFSLPAGFPFFLSRPHSLACILHSACLSLIGSAFGRTGSKGVFVPCPRLDDVDYKPDPWCLFLPNISNLLSPLMSPSSRLNSVHCQPSPCLVSLSHAPLSQSRFLARSPRV